MARDDKKKKKKKKNRKPNKTQTTFRTIICIHYTIIREEIRLGTFRLLLQNRIRCTCVLLTYFFFSSFFMYARLVIAYIYIYITRSVYLRTHLEIGHCSHIGLLAVSRRVPGRKQKTKKK